MIRRKRLQSCGFTQTPECHRRQPVDEWSATRRALPQSHAPHTKNLVWGHGRKSVVWGFTLLETLLYTSTSAVLILVLSIFLSTILQSRVKNQTIMEVEEQGAVLMRFITQTIRNSEAISSPLQGTSDSRLDMIVSEIASNPTIFEIGSGAMRITEGSATPIPLTSSRIIVSNAIFLNLSRTGTPGVIRVQFTMTHVNPAAKAEYTYSKTFYGSASLRNF